MLKSKVKMVFRRTDFVIISFSCIFHQLRHQHQLHLSSSFLKDVFYIVRLSSEFFKMFRNVAISFFNVSHNRFQFSVFLNSFLQLCKGFAYTAESCFRGSNSLFKQTVFLNYTAMTSWKFD